MNIKSGSEVRIADNLSKTKSAFGMNDHMLRMRGTIRTVSYITRGLATRKGNTADGVYIPDDNGNNWTFLKEDLTVAKLTPPIPPVVFDPKNIAR